LPPQAADAMRFFKQKSNGGGDSPSENDDSKAPDLAQLALNTVEMQNQRAQIQESADSHAAELKHEFDNLQVVIKGLQRDLDHNGGKLSDIDGRIKHVEKEAKIQRRLGGGGAEDAAGEGEGDKGDLSHLLDPEGSSPTLPFVSKKSLQQAVEGLREELRNWLDMLHASMLNALQQKADHENVREMVQGLSQVTGTASDSIATFAKRSIIGKCASCDNPFNADPKNVRKEPAPKAQWPAHGSPGAEIAIRPLDGNTRPSTTANGKGTLPKIDGKGTKDFPKGKILKTPSQPELRSLRQHDNA